ncbi:MAG: phenylacetate-CoA ligase, partial [Parcubacteria group bacterium GW2011_GWA2_51_10]
YGSAELGTMATETPLCILVRELSLQHPQLFAKIFTDAPHLPTLAQYIPSFVSFESVDNRIYCTAGSALPLIRYEIGDHGGTFTFSELKRECAALGIDVRAEARQRGIADTLSELPFVFVYERADLSTKLYGAIIYPEHVKVGLMSKTLHAYITGKFTMFTRTDEKHNEYLEINVELQPRARATDQLKQAATDAIVEGLAERNAEHKNNMKALGDRVTPRVVFWPHNHPEHFSPGAKHKWVGRSAS